MVGDERAGTEATRVEPVPAATRPCGPTLFVCPVGWSSEVFQLTGAAAAVWHQLVGPSSIDEVARRCGVDVDDAMLTEAMTMLSSAGLVTSSSEPDPS